MIKAEIKNLKKNKNIKNEKNMFTKDLQTKCLNSKIWGISPFPHRVLLY